MAQTRIFGLGSAQGPKESHRGTRWVRYTPYDPSSSGMERKLAQIAPLKHAQIDPLSSGIPT